MCGGGHLFILIYKNKITQKKTDLRTNKQKNDQRIKKEEEALVIRLCSLVTGPVHHAISAFLDAIELLVNTHTPVPVSMKPHISCINTPCLARQTCNQWQRDSTELLQSMWAHQMRWRRRRRRVRVRQRPGPGRKRTRENGHCLELFFGVNGLRVDKSH